MQRFVWVLKPPFNDPTSISIPDVFLLNIFVYFLYIIICLYSFPVFACLMGYFLNWAFSSFFYLVGLSVHLLYAIFFSSTELCILHQTILCCLVLVGILLFVLVLIPLLLLSVSILSLFEPLFHCSFSLSLF
jgi:hypothetical protein